MGSFYQSLTLLSPGDSSDEVVEALVDTGSIYTMVAETTLTRLEVTPQGHAAYELADGTEQEYGLAEIRVRLDGEERTTVCIFGRPDAHPLNGCRYSGGDWPSGRPC